ncbi:unnamed protein product, partial [Phaeothamnion confervicola]
VGTALKAKAEVTRRIWHECLAHLNGDDLKHLSDCGLINISGTSRDRTYCQACKMGKMRHKYRNNTPREPVTHALSAVHSDVVGPFPPSRNKEKCAIFFVDRWSQYTCIFFMKTKDE